MVDHFIVSVEAPDLCVLLRAFSLVATVLCASFFPRQSSAQTPSSPVCRIESKNFEGWRAEEMSNPWINVVIVPQLGGRVMQVTFGGHAYLFVNPKYKGQYFPPSSEPAKGRWMNYGGDQIWPMPEGTEDEQHWAGPVSDALDDGDYSFKILSEDSRCTVRLDGPADPKTGLQYAREIEIGGNSPEISFHAVMKNITGHAIRWSVQSVTQYDTTEAANPGEFNHEFWAFTPANQHSAYFRQYQVRSGLADDPSFAVNNDLFTLHWQYLQSEVWVDSRGERSEEHTSELQSRSDLVCRLLLEKKKISAMTVARSVLRRDRSFETPASPPAARAQKTRRPSPTALAPRARALTISLPRLIPPFK